jgi:hypothetical protein
MLALKKYAKESKKDLIHNFGSEIEKKLDIFLIFVLDVSTRSKSNFLSPK